MDFLRRHVWAGIFLLLGPIISIGSLILHAYALKELGLPIEIWVAIGLAIFFLGVVGILLKWDREHPRIAQGNRESNVSRYEPVSSDPHSTQARESVVALQKENSPFLSPQATVPSASPTPAMNYAIADPMLSYLRDAYKDRTTAEGDRLVAPHIGQSLKVTGIVKNLSVSEKFGTAIVWMDEYPNSVILYFEKPDAEDAEKLHRGDAISISGNLKHASLYEIALEQCRIAN